MQSGSVVGRAIAGAIAIASNPGRALAVCTAARRVHGAPGNVDAQTPSAGLGSAASVVVVTTSGAPAACADGVAVRATVSVVAIIVAASAVAKLRDRRIPVPSSLPNIPLRSAQAAP